MQSTSLFKPIHNTPATTVLDFNQNIPEFHKILAIQYTTRFYQDFNKISPFNLVWIEDDSETIVKQFLIHIIIACIFTYSKFYFPEVFSPLFKLQNLHTCRDLIINIKWLFSHEISWNSRNDILPMYYHVVWLQIDPLVFWQQFLKGIW